MNYRKKGLKALGLSFLAVLGLMAFAASGASASGLVLLLNAVGQPIPHLDVGVTGEADTPGDDRLWVLGLNLEIGCPAATVNSGLLSSTGHGSGNILFENCTANGVNASGALVGESCSPTPDDIEAKVLILLILHSGGPTAKLGIDLSPPSGTKTEHDEPTTGDPYLLITPILLNFSLVTNENEECLLPESAAVKGCVVAKITTGHTVTHLIDTREMLLLFGCKLTYGNNEAHLEADALVKLTNSSHGNHEGLSWGVE